MFQLIVQLFSTISNGFYYLFWTSYSIGKLISWMFGSAINFLSFIWFNISEAGVIFSEDFLLFLKDLMTVTGNVLDVGKDSILTSLQFLYSIIQVAFGTTKELFTTGNIHSANVGQQCIRSFVAMMNALKDLFVLIGNGAWFIVTLVPNVLYNIAAYIYRISQVWIEMGWKLTAASWSNVKEVASAFVNYFLDVPLQAIIGCSFIVLLVVYRRVALTFLSWLTIRIFQLFSSRLLAACSSLLAIFRRRHHRNRSRLNQSQSRSSTANSPPFRKQSSTEENVCVICRDEQKNVVLLPCKHLCLCIGCSGSIHTCPLCRRAISNILSVYT